MPLKRNLHGPTVVLVGRPNVGKSTLFNRVTKTRRSIVTPIAGTTRDVIDQPADWQNTPFTLIDTGGMFGASTDPLHDLVMAQGRHALEAADVIVFVVDGREGLVPGDEEIAHQLRRHRRRCCSPSTRRMTNEHAAACSSSTSWGSIRCRDRRRARRRGRRSAGRSRSAAADRPRRREIDRHARGDRDCDRRTAECR